MCGIDTSLGSSTDKRIIIYNGLNYDTLQGLCYSGPAYTFEKFNGQLYVGGLFKHIGTPIPSLSDGIHLLARWNGSQFDSIGAFFNLNSGNVNVLKVYNNELYIGGKFTDGAGIGISNLMKYDGITFSPVGGGISGNFTEIFSMVVYNGELIVAGSFFNAGGTPVQNIARWNGTQWFPMGDGLSPYVFCMTVDTVSNILYAGGAIGSSGITPIEKIAWWDGQAWHQVGNGLPSIPSLWSLTMYKGELYAGCGQSIQPLSYSIYKWNGLIWQMLPSFPTDGGIYKLTEYKGSLYATGTFDEIDSICCYNGMSFFSDTTVGLSADLISNKLSFNIYPNPSKNKINLNFHKEINGKANIIIYNSNGEMVFQDNLEIYGNHIEIAYYRQLISGFYLCAVTYGNIKENKSFMVE